MLRRFARLFDDLLTEPHLRRYYNYLLKFGEDDEKGEFVIDARGSSALVERDIHAQELLTLGEFALNPAFNIDPEKWMSEFLKSKRLEPRRFEYDDDDKKPDFLKKKGDKKKDKDDNGDDDNEDKDKDDDDDGKPDFLKKKDDD